MHTPYFSRRLFLNTLGTGIALATSSRVWAQPGPAGRKTKNQGRLVVVFLRGAYDGLSAFIPYADPYYHQLRPNIAIATPDGTTNTALKLDATFGMHPAMAPLLPLWQQRCLSFIPAAGLPQPNRSHFDAQYQMEIAHAGKTNGVPGWLNKLAGTHKTTAIGVGEANPTILSGPAKVKLIPRGQAAERIGVLANPSTRQALMDLYAGHDALGAAFQQGVNSRMQSAQELATEKTDSNKRRSMAAQQEHKDDTPMSAQAFATEMKAANNGATDPIGLQLDAHHLSTLMHNDPQLRLGFLSAGGWDTHANQGNITGTLANNLGNLARGIAQLRQEFNAPDDTIVVMSEFGRTTAENGTKGTDHGFGNALWLIGNQIKGGQWHGKWTDLAPGNLNDNRDLPAHHDYRSVLAQVLRRSFALSDTALENLMPGTRWDGRLDRVMR
jgi:uncharacterized protein (DUF1501 family)